MRSPIIAAVATALLLAGCGGGGASAPAVPNAPGVSSAPSGASLTPQDSAQSASDAAFTPVDTAESDVAVSNGSLGVSSGIRSTQSVGFGCRHRTTRTVTVNAEGSVTTETVNYYDDACTQPERDAVAVKAVVSGTLTVQRTVTTYSLTHAQLGVRKSTYALTGSTGNGSWTVTSAFYPGTSTTPLAQFGHAATLSASAYTATTGRIVNDAAPKINASYGHQVATNATVATDGTGVTTFTGTRNGASFKGALGALTLPAAPPFTISGGTQIGASALTGSIGYDADGTLASVNLSGTLAGGNTLTVTSTPAPNGALTINGTVTSPAGATIATFTTDAHGNGTLTVSATGTQVPIVDWHVIWG